ncbi:HAD-IA family hydrolase [Variovorax sp. PCZ-1]|uniref:HAD-IA family hydrolase n=1 Tax=Variovorax sp. PCZ-1 TaxID=2835533 RepID=UPI001BCE0004|nr:HAD-IA family hydrolase [Variovorax sp. PCZ-1]MBS7806214.1 HAD-IA family hydrolase [Variovorax sp. PCZ-1]
MNIVFDFGAVLVNWRPQEVVRKHFPGFAHSPETAARLANDLFAHFDWQEFDAGRLSPEEVSQLTAKRLKLGLEAVQQMVYDIEDHITPIPSSVQVLQSLYATKVHKFYFLSNMPVLYARGLERHAFMRCFDGGIWSGDHGLVKPQPEIFHKLEAMYGLRNQQTGQQILFIDDHPANIAAAQKEGWGTLHLTDPSKLPELLLAKLAQSMP